MKELRVVALILGAVFAGIGWHFGGGWFLAGFAVGIAAGVVVSCWYELSAVVVAVVLLTLGTLACFLFGGEKAMLPQIAGIFAAGYLVLGYAVARKFTGSAARDAEVDDPE